MDTAVDNFRTACEASGDGNHWKKFAYVFELQAPSAVEESVFFPLWLNPTGFRFQETFAQTVTVCQDRAVHTEEYGIILGRIILDCEPGLARRPAPYSRNVPEGRPYDQDSAATQIRGADVLLSGHARFLQLRQDIFRRYGELKADPATSRDTQLILHVLKDEDAYVVVPETFDLNRDARRATLYPHTITLQVVEWKSYQKVWLFLPARTRASISVSPGTPGLLERVRGGMSTVRDGARMCRLFIEDWTATIAAYGRLGEDVVRTLADTVSVLETAEAGLLTLAAIPANTLIAASSMLRQFIDYQEQVISETGRLWPDFGLVDACTQLEDQFERLGYVLMQSDPTSSNQRGGRMEVSGFSAIDLQTAALSGAYPDPRSTAPSPTDQERQALLARQGREVPVYRSYDAHTVAAFDTPEGIAARYGIPWEDIAYANDLRAPYLSDTDLPGTVRVGATIRIPSLRPGGTLPIPSSEAEQDEVLYGSDFLEDVDEGLAIDVAGGAVDIAAVRGLDNMEQAARTRLETPRGTNLLCPDLGLPFKVGDTLTDDGKAIAYIQLKQAFADDPRVRGVEDVVIEEDGDTLNVSVSILLQDYSNVQVRGRVIM